jgi:serine/threonine-protein kinase
VSAPVEPGDVLAGKYKVERVLGVGGMGVVVVAMHLQLEQRVAIKFLLPAAVGNAEAAGRFAREAKAAARIQSEHVARVLDVSTLESGAPYMVMEYLDGRDLSQTLQVRGPLPIDEAVEYVLQALEALAEAHAAGIVHRDLKPANLFLSKRADGSPTVKVLDFGISKLTTTTGGLPDMAMTKTTSLMGSPLYMSPEQMRASKNVDARSDIWSVGIILHELLSGASAFVADTMPQLVASILSDPPPPLSTVRPGTPPALEAAILKCLEKAPEARFQNVAELARALGPFGPARGQTSIDRITRVVRQAGGVVSSTAPPALAMVPPAGAVSGAGTMSPWGATGPTAATPKKSATGMIVGVAVAAVLVIAAVAVVVVKSTSTSTSTSTSPSTSTSTSTSTASATDSAPPPIDPPIASASPSASASASPSAKPSATAARPLGVPARSGGPAAPPQQLPGFGGRR